ncbi:hypothetical protein [uncultured Litoreibacter sp.]|uniref:hypothetical protein n=1 Tax=uncultured Litoreibacter sp. TaxID=1392394 RepID=UPI0026271244|nr:hypothetical protein [uncultured Litoreibacter sp.]
MNTIRTHALRAVLIAGAIGFSPIQALAGDGLDRAAAKSILDQYHFGIKYQPLAIFPFQLTDTLLRDNPSQLAARTKLYNAWIFNGLKNSEAQPNLTGALVPPAPGMRTLRRMRSLAKLNLISDVRWSSRTYGTGQVKLSFQPVPTSNLRPHCRDQNCPVPLGRWLLRSIEGITGNDQVKEVFFTVEFVPNPWGKELGSRDIGRQKTIRRVFRLFDDGWRLQ